MGQPRVFRSGVVLPLVAIAFISAAIHSLLTAKPFEYGLGVFRWLSQPQMEPVRIGLAVACLPIIGLYSLHLLRRLAGQATLEIGDDRIVFQGFLRREIPISEIDRIEVRHGDALIRLKRGQAISVPVLLLTDFHGARRALERTDERIQRTRTHG